MTEGRWRTQSGLDITRWFPELAAIVGELEADGLARDGEIVGLGPEGDPDLSLMAKRLSSPE